MNRKGQVLILFVMMLPIILLFIYYVGNKLYLDSEKHNQESIARNLCKYYKKERNIVKIEELATRTDDKQKVTITEKEDTIEITLIKLHKNILKKKNEIKTVLKCE